MLTPQLVLQDTFGYKEFRPLQEKVILNILAKRDTMVIMPTGGGKSLCYQIPALIFEGLTVVISPLISLMKDQVEQLNEAGVNAVLLNSTLSNEDYQRNTDLVSENKVKLLYVAPETLLMEKTINLLSSIKLDCLTIDEAHCISEWGHDFRPEYRQIIDLRSKFPDTVCVALTATATPRVQTDIKNNLNINSENDFIASFNRENLFIQITPKTNPLEQIIGFLEKYKNQSGIIYCFSRRQVEELYEDLKDFGYSVKPYHAGLQDTERHRNQELFIKDDVQIIVATIAFGMGINKSNVRFVIHHDLPKNIESYYQEIGRAGRDSLRADCLLLFSYGDIQKIKYFINQKDEKEKRVASFQLNQLVQYAETDACRRTIMLDYFGEHYKDENCGMCDNCLNPDTTKTDLTIEAQKFLSCVKRTGEIFGTNHVIDVLRGSESQKVLEKNHNQLSTYGIGKDYSKQQWQHFARQFQQSKLLNKDFEYGSLTITDLGIDVLKGERKVMGVIEQKEIKYQNKTKIDEDYNQDLFEILRKKRKEIADSMSIPAFVIFSDKSLVSMASLLPLTIESFLNVHGVGQAKAQKYGKTFLKLITDFSEKNSLENTSLKNSPKSLKTRKTKRSILVGEALSDGKSVDEVMSDFNFGKDTLIKHIYNYLLEDDKTLDEEILLELLPKISEELQIAVFKLFEDLGISYLKPIYQEMEEQIDYETLHILRVVYLNHLNLKQNK